jgi:hypothetical protein
LWRVAEQFSRQRNICIAMPYVADSEFASNFCFNPETGSVYEFSRQRSDGGALTRSQIEYLSRRDIRRDRGIQRRRYVGDMNEIARFETVFVNWNHHSLPRAIEEYRDNSSVRILQRLAFAINILESKNYCTESERIGG